MRELDKISESLFEKIRSRFEDVSLGDENAKATSDPEQARFFNFDYVDNDGNNHGNLTISLVDDNSLKIYFSKNISNGLDVEEKARWYQFLRELRLFAKRNMLNFEPRDITRKSLKHRDIQQQSKADSTFNRNDIVGESRMWGTRRSSYEDEGPVKIIVRHSANIDPEQRGARSRKIEGIFLETQEGERRKLKHNSLKYARAMAQNLVQGGTMDDEFACHITEIADELAKLGPFKNSMRRRTFEDQETQQMAEAAFEYHGLLNNTLKRMGGTRGHQACKEQFTATSTSYIPEDDLDVDAIRERFVKRTFNDRWEDALPLVHKAYKMKKENKFAEQFESWANTVITDGLDASQEYGAEMPGDTRNMLENSELSAQDLQDLLELIDDASGVWGDDSLASEIVSGTAPNMTPAMVDFIKHLESEDNIGKTPAEFLEEIRPQIEDAITSAEADKEEHEEVNEEDEHEDSAYESVVSAITRRIIHQHSDLLKQHGPEAVLDAIKDVASFNDDVQEIGSSDVSNWVHQVARQLGSELVETPLRQTRTPAEQARDAKYYDYLAKTLGEGKMKDIEIDLQQLSDEEFQAKYNKSKEEVKAELAEAVGDDYANKDLKMAQAGAHKGREPSLKDKIMSIPRGFKAMRAGEPEDDDSLHLANMKRLAGLK